MDNSHQKDIKTIFQEAAEMVKDLPQNLQEKAFELAFLRLSTPKVSDNNMDTLRKSPIDEEVFFDKVSQETGLNLEQIKGVYKIDKNGALKIVAPLIGRVSEKQRTLAYLYLFGMKIGYGKEWVPSLEFADRAKDYGANDGHISKSLTKDKVNILQEGRKRGKEYALSPNGILNAKEILNGIVNK